MGKYNRYCFAPEFSIFGGKIKKYKTDKVLNICREDI